MTREVAALTVRLEATAARFNRQMRSAQRSFDQSSRNIERRAKSLRSRLAGVGDGFGARFVTQAAVATTAIVAISKAVTDVVQNGDRLRLLESRFAALTGSAERGEAQFRSVLDTATELGVAIDDVAQAQTRFTLAAQNIGATDDQVAKLTQTVLQLGRIGGSTTQELSAGSTQLAQALASGRLQGDELRSVLENLPLVAKQIAEGLGVGVGQLREMASEGELTAERVFGALLKGADDTERRFRDLPVTVDQAATKLANSWATFTAELDNSLGVSEALVVVLTNASNLIASLSAAPIADQALLDMQNKAVQVQNTLDNLAKQGIDTGPAFDRASAELERLNKAIVETERLAFKESRPVSLGKPPPQRPEVIPRSFSTDLDTGSVTGTGGATKKSGGSRQRVDNEAVRILDSLRKQSEALVEQRRLIGLEEREQVKLSASLSRQRVERELLAAASKDGSSASKEEIVLAQNLAREVEQLTLIVHDQTEANEAAAEAAADAKKQNEDLAQTLAATSDRFIDAAQRAGSFKEALANIGLELANLVAKGLVGQGALGGLFNSAFGVETGGAAGLLANAKGNAFQGGNVIPLAKGGVVSSPTLFPMRGGTGLMGEAGPEAIVPLRRGSGGGLGVGALPANVNVVVENNAGVQVNTSASNGPNGTELRISLDQEMAGIVASPGSQTSRALRATVGAGPARR